jgi:hypothetical protein
MADAPGGEAYRNSLGSAGIAGSSCLTVYQATNGAMPIVPIGKR